MTNPTRKHHKVVAAVIMDNNEILCMQRGQTKYEYTSFKWEFPGGKIEDGETPEQALHREILEEMNMDIKVCKLLTTTTYNYPDFTITMSAFLCKPIHNRYFEMREHNNYCWLSSSNLTNLDWAAADVEIMNSVKSLF